MKRSLVLLLAVLSLAVPLAGCKMISKMMPASTIDNPSEGSPEWVVYRVIEAGQVADDEKSWQQVRPYLHSSVTALATSENNFLNLNWAAFRRKIRLFTPDDAKPVYKLDYTQDDVDDKELRLFVVNEGSDQPSPFRVVRDGASNNEWKVKTIP